MVYYFHASSRSYYIGVHHYKYVTKEYGEDCLMATQFDLFKGAILAQLFFSFAITLFVYSLPANAITYAYSFSDISGTPSLNSTSVMIQESLQSQTNIPVINVGALLFYSGNMIIDLLLNFMFAVPQMMGLLVHGLVALIGGDSYIWVTVELFTSVATVALYMLGLIELLTNVRSGRVI